MRRSMLADLEAQNRISAELESGERVLWGGFALFWEASVLSSSGAQSSLINALWGVPFVVVGLYLTVGRLFARRWIRERTLYALTDQRAIAIAPAWPRGLRTKSVWLGSHPAVEKRTGRGGQGTLLIGSLPRANRWLTAEPGWPGAGAAAANAVVFADIADVEDVYSRTRGQLSELTRARTA